MSPSPVFCEPQPTNAARAPHPTQGLCRFLVSLSSLLPGIETVVLSFSFLSFPALHSLLFSLYSLLHCGQALLPALGYYLVLNCLKIILMSLENCISSQIWFYSHLGFLCFFFHPVLCILSLSCTHRPSSSHTHTQTPYCSACAWLCGREAKEHLRKFWLGKNK